MHPISDSGGASVPAFLAKLWRLVEDPETNHLIYWNSDGRSFIIQNQAQFARELLPLNYKHNNMASFIRQLNMYGFHKITSLDNGGLKFDRDEMEFSHPCFQRGHPFMLENIKRKIAHNRNHPEEKVSAPPAQSAAVVKPETLNRVLNEVKMMRGKQEVLDNRFSAMKQENEALWREVVMLRQKHMKQQQIVNKLIQFLVTIVQPSGRGNMGMKRRLPLMINEAPSASKQSRKSTSSDYGLEISSMADSEDDEEGHNAYMDLMSLDSPIVLQSKVMPSSSSRGMISEIPNTPSSTRSHHDDLEDIDEIIEEEAPAADVDKIFEELNEATSTGEPIKKKPQKQNSNGKAAADAGSAPPVVTKSGDAIIIPLDESTNNSSSNVEIDQFLKFNEGSNPMAGSSSSSNTQANQGAQGNEQQNAQDKQVKTWYANKDGFISTEIPTDLFEDQASLDNSMMGMQDRNVNPTLSEDISKKLDEAEAAENNKKKGNKFNGKHLQLARLPSNTGDVLSLSTPEDFNMHLENVQSDLNALKGILTTDVLSYDPSQLAGQRPQQQQQQPPGMGSMDFNSNVLMSLVENDYVPKMFDEQNIFIPYQLSGDCLGDLPNVAGGLAGDVVTAAGKDEADKQLLQYNPPDFSELLDASLDSTALGQDADYLTSVDDNGSLNTPQPQ